MLNNIEKNNKIVLFRSSKIRRIWHANEWFYSVVDIVGALTESTDSKDYWYRVKRRMSDDEKTELSTICRQLKLKSADGKKYPPQILTVLGCFL
ncbi:MAG: hypothetical protein U9Q72_03750 [Patescibacteria group bacterium]|nr:hypothetical protein [Patescibacteria group bacterium]